MLSGRYRRTPERTLFPPSSSAEEIMCEDFKKHRPCDPISGEYTPLGPISVRQTVLFFFRDPSLTALQ